MNPGTQEFLIVIVRRRWRAFQRGIVPCQISIVEFLIPGLRQPFRFLGRKVTRMNPLDLKIQFAMNSGTGHAEKATERKIHTVGEFGGAIGAFAVGGDAG